MVDFIYTDKSLINTCYTRIYGNIIDKYLVDIIHMDKSLIYYTEGIKNTLYMDMVG